MHQQNVSNQNTAIVTINIILITIKTKSSIMQRWDWLDGWVVKSLYISISPHLHAHRSNSHAGKFGLASCPFDSQSSVTLIHSILIRQAKTVPLQTVPCPFTLATVPRGLEAKVFTGQLPFPLPNQQCHSTEGKISSPTYTVTYKLLSPDYSACHDSILLSE